MRRADEDHLGDEWQRLDEDTAAEQVFRLRWEIRLLDRHLKVCVPEAAALSTTVILVSRPSWLWPMTTICRKARSVPLGSTSATTCWSASRNPIAEYATGLPVL
jgi:hypothetical protein